MKIISFALTVPALLAGRKSRTRREWPDRYASMFKAGDHCQAFDRSPRFGGKQIAIIEIIEIKKQHLSEMNAEDYEKEGFKYFEDNGLKIWNKEATQAFNDWREDDQEVYVIDFKVLK
jgi:hypothetical protein